MVLATAGSADLARDTARALAGKAQMKCELNRGCMT
ncbi:MULTISPECIES: hypothetical protein [Gammaproteobacteria]